ncbi:hypothetical protein [Nocardioides euryhalodurans]|uniref:Uncharacterized protein n=1 Tax=Nocardioides euryhalodurans TaxID=2518370 RepID=A0A4V1BDF9_9ACTN|nr:hypothetical protein [Nocardioides euryhalodurans]QBR90982.1 hypothetical protein EXE57_00885 [Nocardioides euryhalodurans]
MPRLREFAVELQLPFLGKVAGVWAPDDRERQAAWELYVEMVTRVAVVPLVEGGGSLREALSSHYTLFATTREILKKHGPELARPHDGGQLSFGYIAIAVLNGAVRPLLTEWHPRLETYEGSRPAGRSPVEWERAWADASTMRAQVEACRTALLDYAELLAEVADIQLLHGHEVGGSPSSS